MSRARRSLSEVVLPRAVPGDDRLRVSFHDATSLEAYLQEHGARPSTARSVAAKVLRYVYSDPLTLAPEWTTERLGALGVGRWAHEALGRLEAGVTLEVAERAPAADGTERMLMRARDGAVLETVLIPGPARTTVCISSQAGCARACAFCETGTLGLTRQLSTAEIVDQLRIARAVVAANASAPPLSNVVFMGMGEPFDNLEEVIRATRLMCDGRAFNLARARITVSTVGVADKLEAFFREAHAELAVSLNASSSPQRRTIMPIEARFPLDVLRAELVRTLPPGRRVFFEYVLFDGFNDSPEDAERLATLVTGIRCRVNVIPANPGPDPRLRPAAPERVSAFVAHLAARRVRVLVRRPRGRDVGGACGQLAGARRRAADESAPHD